MDPFACLLLCSTESDGMSWYDEQEVRKVIDYRIKELGAEGGKVGRYGR